MLRVRRVEFQFVVSDPLIPRTSHESYSVRDLPRFQKRIHARTLMRLGINLFALLNVILFYCWIKQTGNLMFHFLIHITSPEDVSHVIEGRDYVPSMNADTIYISTVHITKKKKINKIRGHKRVTLQTNRV